MTMITPSYLGETIEYSSLHACRSTLEDPTALPLRVRRSADKSYELLKANPDHPSLHFKRVGRHSSVRIGLRHRALAVELDGNMIWFWIGSHTEYDKLIR